MKTTSLAILSIALLTSCKKYVAPTTDTTNYIKTATISQNGQSVIYKYSYDYAGRITSTVAPNDSTKWEYTNTGFIETHNSQKEIGTMGARFGLVDSVITPNGGRKYRYDRSFYLAFIYTYDKSGKLINTEKFGVDENKDLAWHYDANRKVEYTFTNIRNTQDNGFKFYRQNQHLIKEAVYSGTVNQVNSYDYELDEKGRVTKETMKVNGNLFRTTTYTY